MLEKVNFFKSISHRQREGLARIMRIVYYQPEDIIFRIGDRGESFFVLVDGEVTRPMDPDGNVPQSQLAVLAGWGGVVNGSAVCV